jgi:adenylate cyclase
VNGSSGAILVVDDEPANVRLLGRLLTAEGYDVRVAISGEDALAQIDRRMPDLVLLDVVLPGMSGYEVCQSLRGRAETRLLPVILVTGSRPEQERVRGLDAGADEFLTKPVNREELLARVRALLRVGALHREVEEWGHKLEERVRQQVAQLERFNRLKDFLPQRVAELVTADGGDGLLEPRRRQVAVCVIDIRGFTAFAEAAQPEAVVEMLREYFAAMGEIVERHGGTVERFVGDGMVTFFNAPIEIEHPEAAAVQAGIEMRGAFGPLRDRWAARGHTLGLGIGISSGLATVGAIGFAQRWQYAATGTVTNVSARLCAEAAHGQILVTPRVLGSSEDRFEVESLGEMSLRGLQHPLPVFNVLGSARPAA